MRIHFVSVILLLLLLTCITDEKSRPLLTMAGVFDVWNSNEVRSVDALQSFAGAVLASGCIFSNFVPICLSIYLCLSARSAHAAKLPATAD